MRIAVVGYGTEGAAAVAYWSRRGDDVTVHDRRTDISLPDGVEARLGAGYLDGLEHADLVVRSPGIRPDVLPPGVPRTSVTREFLQRCPAPVIGVTGTNGKGTTATAITAIVRASGRRAHLGGNIGTAALGLLDDVRPDDVVVLELSSFQLIDVESSPTTAVVLAVTPDHLDWHTDLDEYVAAKAGITRFQRAGDVVVYDAANEAATRVAAAGDATKVPVGDPAGVAVVGDTITVAGEPVAHVSDIRLLGRHNVTNIAAAIGATYPRFVSDPAVVRRAVASVEPLPHRLENLGEIGGVTYVNDSLSTTPHTTMAALRSFDRPVVVILGGSSKGVDMAPLASAVASADVRRVLLTGQEAKRIACALDDVGYDAYELVAGDMDALVTRAAEEARPGDVVLLSPACASFDAYANYADRGDRFRSAVERLAAR